MQSKVLRHSSINSDDCPMKIQPPMISTLREELYDWRLWTGRGVVMAFAAMAGLTVVVFTWMTEHALAYFFALEKSHWWSPLLWTPACTASIVWLTRRYAPGAAGSGIPQVMAALTPEVSPGASSLYVSLKLTFAKMVLTAWGLLAGLSIGREGPSVQIAAGVIRVENLSMALLLPGLLVAVCSGVAGGLFARLMVISLAGKSKDWFSQLRRKAPVRFAAGCGLAVAVLGVVSHGDTFGSGYSHTRDMLEGNGESSALYVLLKFMATWITAWSGVPGGIFAPSLAIGGALGNDIAQLTAYANAPTLIALGMAGFLAAVTQAPLTAFIIVMEMVDGHGLVLSLMASALVASGVSRLISAPLYSSLAELQLQRLPPVAATNKTGA
jgi:H+/Cl- antiporter ClcA